MQDIYVERIKLAADAVCQFGSELLASCTTPRPISPAVPPEELLMSPSSLVVTQASCWCTFSETFNLQRNDKRAPQIPPLTSRLLALTAAKATSEYMDGDGDDFSSTDEPKYQFQPPALTVAVATSGCCGNNYQQSTSSVFDASELANYSSLVVFPVPLSRIGSVIRGSVSAVIINAEVVLANRGSAVLAQRGSGLLAMAARHQWHCPVIVLAETYKIVAGGQDEIDEALKGLSDSRKSKVNTHLYTEDYDVISADMISVVVTEVGCVPASALTSILRLSQRARPSRKQHPAQDDPMEIASPSTHASPVLEKDFLAQ